MQSIDLIRDNLKKSTNRVLTHVEGMRDSATVYPTAKGGCHAHWLIGHLAYSEQQILQGMMLGGVNPLAQWQDLFGHGTEPNKDASKYPPFDEVLAELRRVRESTTALLDSLSEDDLDKASAMVPEGLENTFGTYRHCLQFAADHWYMHRGQLADARRAAGLDRAGF
jgi:uncharacterized damage-inducible protein DinB